MPSGQFEGAVVCTVSPSIDSTQQIVVDLSFNVEECCSLNGRYVRYLLQQSEQEKRPSTLPNAFSILMLSARELKLPSRLLTPERYESGRGDQRLHDDVISFLETKNLGFGPGSEGTVGKQVVRALTDALFYFQPHRKTVEARIPKFFPPYFACLLEKIYNDPKAHKHAIQPLKCEMIEKVVLHFFLCCFCLQWNPLGGRSSLQLDVTWQKIATSMQHT